MPIALSVEALLVTSSFSTQYFFFLLTLGLLMNHLIVITLVVQELNFDVQDCGEWLGDVGAQNSILSAALFPESNN